MNRKQFHEGVRIDAELNKADRLRHDAFNKATNLAHETNSNYKHRYGVAHPNPNIRRGDHVYHQNAEQHHKDVFAKLVSPKKYARYKKIVHSVKYTQHLNRRNHITPPKNLKLAWGDMMSRAKVLKTGMKADQSDYKLASKMYKGQHLDPSMKNSHFGKIYYNVTNRLNHAGFHSQNRAQNPFANMHRRVGNKQTDILDHSIDGNELSRAVSPKHYKKYKSIKRDVNRISDELADDPHNSTLRALHQNRMSDAMDVKSDMDMRKNDYRLGRRFSKAGIPSKATNFYHTVRRNNDPNYQAHIKSQAEHKHNMAIKMDKAISPKQYHQYKTFKSLLDRSDQFDPNRSAYKYKVHEYKQSMHERFGEYKIGEKMHKKGIDPNYFENAPYGKIYHNAQKRLNPTNQLKKQFQNSLNQHPLGSAVDRHGPTMNRHPHAQHSFNSESFKDTPHTIHKDHGIDPTTIANTSTPGDINSNINPNNHRLDSSTIADTSTPSDISPNDHNPYLNNNRGSVGTATIGDKHTPGVSPNSHNPYMDSNRESVNNASIDGSTYGSSPSPHDPYLNNDRGSINSNSITEPTPDGINPKSHNPYMSNSRGSVNPTSLDRPTPSIDPNSSFDGTRPADRTHGMIHNSGYVTPNRNRQLARQRVDHKFGNRFSTGAITPRGTVAPRSHSRNGSTVGTFGTRPNQTSKTRSHIFSRGAVPPTPRNIRNGSAFGKRGRSGGNMFGRGTGSTAMNPRHRRIARIRHMRSHHSWK